MAICCESASIAKSVLSNAARKQYLRLVCHLGGHLGVAEYLATKMGHHLLDSNDGYSVLAGQEDRSVVRRGVPLEVLRI